MKKNNSIEDIYINSEENKPKKGKKGIIVALFFLLIILLALCGAYYYFTQMKVTKKQAFAKAFLNTNINSFLNNTIYNDVLDRLLSENSETETKITVSGNKDLDGIDLSNFEAIVNDKYDAENKSNYAEATLNYSGNKLFELKAFASEEILALASDEIVTKYVGVHTDKMQDTLGVDIDEEDIDQFSDLPKIEFSEEDKSNFTKKYLNKIFEQIPEEKFTKQENISLKKENKDVNVVSYSLELTQQEVNDSIAGVLTELRNDEELLNKFISGKSSTNTIKSVEKNNFNSSIELDATPTSDVRNEVLNITSEEDEDSVIFEEDEEDVDTIITQKDEDDEKMLSILPIFCGRKADITLSDLQEILDNAIENVKELEGDGIKVVVYVSDLDFTEKISLAFSDKTTLDIEFEKDEQDENNNSIQITFLTENEDTVILDEADDEDEENVITYSAEDDITKDTETEKTTKQNGIKISLNQKVKDSKTTLEVKVNNIEDTAYNREISFSLDIKGNKSSSSISNDIVVDIKDNKDVYQVVLENKTDFKDEIEIEEITSQNCVFLDELSEEELSTTMVAIMQKISEVFEEKMESLMFIDTNTSSQSLTRTLENASTSISKEDAKKMLIEEFQKLYKSTTENGEEFTMETLKDLKIGEYDVSVNIADDMAVIVIDTHTFKINSNFELIEE